MIDNLKRLRTAFFAALPVILAVFVLYFTGLLAMDVDTVVVFVVCSFIMVLGMFLFNLGAETSMSKMGELVGSSITKKGKIVNVVVIFFLFGVFITLAEPDLSVLASQVSINSYLLVFSIAIGVGIFCVIGAIRILMQKSLKMWLLAFYGMMFAIACLVPDNMIPLSLDSGGVTTGPITVPFILAIGVGLATSRGGKNSNADSFGLVAFSSIGPILTVMILSIIVRKSAPYEVEAISNASMWESFLYTLIPHNGEVGILLQVLISLAPIVVFFMIYNFIALKLPKTKILRLINGVGYVYIGLVLFMLAVTAGFMPLGKVLGIQISDKAWLLVLVGAFLGIGAALAEPAVHVLTDQIEVVSDGAVSKYSVLLALTIGNGIAIGVSMLRIVFPSFELLYFIVPGYILAFFLSFAVPDIYTAIAFDSGGVVSGPMNTTFILPFAISACLTLHNPDQVMQSAFGTVATVALMPLITVQLLGLYGVMKTKRIYRNARERIRDEFDNQIIHF